MAKKRVTAKKSTPADPAAKGSTAAELKKIQTLLKAKTGDAVTLAVGLLESLNASEEEWSGVFSEQVVGQLIRTWNEDVWKAVLEGVNSRPPLLARVKTIAIEKLGSLSKSEWEDFLVTLLTIFPEAASGSLVKREASAGQFSDRWLQLSHLTSLSDAAAKSLGKHKGVLDLRGLTSLSDAAAESLGKHKGELDLRGLTSLSYAAAAASARLEVVQAKEVFTVISIGDKGTSASTA